MSKAKIVSLSPLPAGVIEMFISPYISGREVEIIAIEKSDEDYLAEIISDADILLGDFSFNVPINKNILNFAKKLKLIQQPSVGYQHIDIDGCRELNIPVANTAGANDISVAEHTLMLGLALLKKLFFAHQKTSQYEWPQLEVGGSELYEKTWGIIGMGKIGKEVAKRIIAFGAKIIYFDKFKLSEESEKELNVSFRPLDRLIRESDIISLHLPLTPETKQIISEKQIRMMRPSTILINVARGELVDEQFLANALKKKSIAGAGIDVFSTEPIAKDNPFVGLPNVILTPHIAGATNEARQRIIQKAVTNIVRVLNGEKPIDVVNGVGV